MLNEMQKNEEKKARLCFYVTVNVTGTETGLLKSRPPSTLSNVSSDSTLLFKTALAGNRDISSYTILTHFILDVYRQKANKGKPNSSS
jgi:hypothetical protein